ncbi:MAG: SRPBCC family protein [Bacteroidota bacterium]
MKIKLKKIGFIILSILLLSLVLNLIQSPITIENEVNINASNHEVFTVLASYKKFTEWSPFLVTDPKQKNWITGEDGLVGSKFHWEGVGEESEGFQELVRFERPNLLIMQCVISVPFESNPTFRYDLINHSNTTTVKQKFTMPSSVLNKIMMAAFGVVEEISSTNILGLERLKKYVETNLAAS